MEEFAELYPATLVILTAIVGFVVVSKLFDFFTKGSSWEDPSAEPENTQKPPALPPANEPDPKRSQKEEYKRFLTEEKKRREGKG